MPEPLTLAAVGTVVFSEGIKFLYGQAAEVLKRWRERKSTPPTDAAPAKPEAWPPNAPPILEGALAPPTVHFDRLEPLAGTMRELWNGLSAYAQGLEDVDVTNADLVMKADALRRQLEMVFGQRITFKGESREPTGTPVVFGKADVEELAGEAAGVVAGTITLGEIRGEVTVKRVEAGGKAYGVKVDRIGPG
jgi:hypothetical protein